MDPVIQFRLTQVLNHLVEGVELGLQLLGRLLWPLPPIQDCESIIVDHRDAQERYTNYMSDPIDQLLNTEYHINFSVATVEYLSHKCGYFALNVSHHSHEICTAMDGSCDIAKILKRHRCILFTKLLLQV